MPRRTPHSIVENLAAQAGAEVRSSWPRQIARYFFRRLKPRLHPKADEVLIAGGDLPRNLDDPLSDPAVQARIGKAIAKQAKKPRRSA